MLKLVGLSLGLWLALALLSWGFRVAGQGQAAPNSIAQFHLSDCRPPCWIGIIPGQTTIAEAKARIVATFSGQHGLQIKDSGFADGPVYENAVENTIEGDNFSLLVRLNLSALVDGRSERVQSIGLFESRVDRSNYAPTVEDILGTFGAPQWVGEEETLGLGKEITLRYAGMDAVYFTRIDRMPLKEIPRLYLGSQAVAQTPFLNYRRWTWAGTFGQG
jgi:hypothetical protein